MGTNQWGLLCFLVALFVWGCTENVTGVIGSTDDASILVPTDDARVHDSNPTPGGGLPGTTCNCDVDCVEVDGYEGICVSGICMNMASGKCVEQGTPEGCPEGSQCWSGICWPDCNTYECAGECDSDRSCIAPANMNCDPECGYYCPLSGIGSQCADDSECGGAQCYASTGWINGYCLDFGCDSPGNSCGSGGVCVGGLTNDGTHVCMASCEAQACRAGYECVVGQNSEKFCMAGCDVAHSECPTGYICKDVEYESGGTHQLCVLDFSCSVDRPDIGDCPDGQICVGSECELFTCGDTLMEPNESEQSAQEISGKVEGLQICEEDNDWFDFTPSDTGAKGQIHVIGVTSHYGSGDLEIELETAGGELLNTATLEPNSFHEEHPSTRGPMVFEGYAIVADPDVETFKLHVFGHKGAKNNYNIVWDRIPYQDGPSCLDAGFSAFECSGFSSSGRFDVSKMIIFPMSHENDPYVGNGFIYTTGHSMSYVSTATMYARRDVIMALRHAMHVVQKTYEGTAPLGIGEITMPDGTTPWGHPWMTHYYGSTLDFSYFIKPEFLGTWGNSCYRQICNDDVPYTMDPVDTNAGVCRAGSELTHIVDIERTALYLAELAATGLVRVFGVDPAPEAELDAEFDRLEGLGHPGAATARRLMATANDHTSWVWHWHHIHMAFKLPNDPGYSY